jgi:surface protein
MKMWGTKALARLRLIISGRALPESGQHSPIRHSKSEDAEIKRGHGQRLLARGLWLILLPVLLLGVGLTTVAVTTPTQSVQAATFDQSAYNASSKKGTWYIYTALNNTGTATSMGGAQIYLDSAGTLHIAGTAPTTALATTIFSGTFQLSDVKALSFEGPTVFIDKSLGLFQKFPNVQKITGLENVDVSRMTTMDYLFSSHTSSDNSQRNTNAALTTIEGTSNWNTSNVTSMNYTFQDQPNLTSVDGIQNWNTSKVTSMKSLFYLDSSLAQMPDLSGWNTSKVTDTSYAFANMDALKSIDSVRNWKMQSATTIEGMFQNDPLLTFGGRFNWDTSSVVHFANVFLNDTAATSLDLSNWNVAAGDDFSQMFMNMTGLTSLDLTGWQPTNATELGFMFHNDSKLTSLPGIAGWTLANAANMQDMLSGMSSVTALPVEKWQLNSSSDANITNIFWGDNALTKLDLTGWHIKSAWGAGDKVFPTYDYSSSTLQSQLKSITFGKDWTGKVVLPQFLLSAGKYGAWRGENHDKDNVAGAGTAKETYTPPSTAADRVETFRFAYDILAKIVNSKGDALALVDVPITITDDSGTKVVTAKTGADGTVTLPVNSTGGNYTATLGDLPSGYSASVGTATVKIVDQDVPVTFVVDEQNDGDLVDKYPHAGGTGTLFTLIAGVLAIVLGTVGIAYVRWQA